MPPLRHTAGVPGPAATSPATPWPRHARLAAPVRPTPRPCMRLPSPQPPRAAADVRGFGRPAGTSTAANPLALPPPPALTATALRAGYGPTPLAFLGDAVWELHARAAHFTPPRKLTAYYESVTAVVRAEAQAASAEQLAAGAFLTAEERDVLRWGRNARVRAIPKRLTGGGEATAGVYRDATALEVLVGWLYVTDPPRLGDLMAYLGLGLPGVGSAAGLGGAVVDALVGKEEGGGLKCA